RITIHEPTRALTTAEETTDTNEDTIGPPAEAAKPRGTEIAALMTPPRMETTRIEPRRDHRWPRVIRQLLERPPTALAFSIMIADTTNVAIASMRMRPKFTVGNEVGGTPPNPPPTKTVPKMANERTAESAPVAAPRARYTTKNGRKFFVYTSNIPESMSEKVA